jgi:hypothetical protein
MPKALVRGDDEKGGTSLGKGSMKLLGAFFDSECCVLPVDV